MSSALMDVDFERFRILLPYLVIGLASFGLYRTYAYIYPATDLYKVPGPPSAHFFMGNLLETFKNEAGAVHKKWANEYGHVVAYKGFLNRPVLMLTDLRALSHVLKRTDVYQKEEAFARSIIQLMGKGVLAAEDEPHRLQRKVLNPAFGPLQLREQTGVFLDKANELKDVLLVLTQASTSGSVTNVYEYLTHALLDIIGRTGFGYNFKALAHGSESDELSRSFSTVFQSFTVAPISTALSIFVPGFSLLPTRHNRETRAAKSIMNRIGGQLLAERKANALLEAAQGEKISHTRARDLLSLLVRANTATDPRERLSDDEVLAQIPTFLLGGHETTSTLMSWVLLQLASNPSVQAALRDECRANPLPAASPDFESSPLDADELSSLDKLPLLDAVIRETLRLHPPVTNVGRAAVKDDIIPLTRPFVNRDGVVQDTITIKKHDAIYVPIILINQSVELWGTDAEEWKPERWMAGHGHAGVPAAVKDIPALWGNMLSFLAGPRACIGFRFSLYQAKILLHALITTLSFELSQPREDYVGQGDIVQRPMLRTELEKGAQLPLLLRRVEDL